MWCGGAGRALQEAGKAPPEGFKVESTPGAAELVLRRSFEGEDIAVIVSSPEEDDEDDLGDFGEDDEEGAAQEGAEEVACPVASPLALPFQRFLGFLVLGGVPFLAILCFYCNGGGRYVPSGCDNGCGCSYDGVSGCDCDCDCSCHLGCMFE